MTRAALFTLSRIAVALGAALLLLAPVHARAAELELPAEPLLAVMADPADLAGPDETDEASDDEDEDTPERAEIIERVVEMSCRDEQGRPESWLDRTHSYLKERLCEPAAWFDGFFGDPRAEEETPVGSFFRVRNSLIWDQEENLGHNLRISANISLPRVSDRVRLLVSRGEDRDDDETDPRAGDEDEKTRLGLRYLLSEMGETQFDIDGTVRLQSGGLNPRVRGRARHTRGLTDATLARLTQTVFWERTEGFGTASRADWEWLPSNKTLVRLTAGAMLSEDSDGVEWRTGLVGFRQLNRKTAIRSEIGAFGQTRPDVDTEEYFVNFRFRRSFLRDWLFYELQPEYAWPLDEATGERRSDWRFYLTLEVQFENPGFARIRASENGNGSGEHEAVEQPLDHYRGR
jgi:hypothetical protein